MAPKPKNIAKAAANAAQPIRAYHGSPHDFDRFDASKIGTGEGAQSYGHGLYFAENPAVANWYRERLAGAAPIERLTVAGKSVGPFNNFDYSPKGRTNEENILSSLIEDMLIDESGLVGVGQKNLTDYALTRLKEKMDDYASQPWPEGLEAGKKLQQMIASPGGVRLVMGKQPGKAYEVEIARPREDFLQWDVPMSNQSPQVQEAVRSLGVDFGKNSYPSLKQARNLFSSSRVRQLAAEDMGVRSALRDGWLVVNEGDEDDFRNWFDKYGRLISPGRRRDIPGNQAYERIAAQSYSPDADMRFGQGASKALAERGVPGVTYLDEFSRTPGYGTSNFVMFPGTEDSIAILRKYGLLPAVGAGAAAQGSQQNDQRVLGGLLNGGQ